MLTRSKKRELNKQAKKSKSTNFCDDCQNQSSAFCSSSKNRHSNKKGGAVSFEHNASLALNKGNNESVTSRTTSSQTQETLSENLAKTSSQTDLSATAVQKMSAEEIAKALAESTKDLVTQWTKENKDFNRELLDYNLSAIDKILKQKSDLRIHNTLTTPTFGGDPSEDVIQFIEQFDIVAGLQKWTESDKNAMFPLSLRNYALSWYNADSSLKGKPYNELSEALKKNYDSESIKYRFEQQLSDCKQGDAESVASFPKKVRDIASRLKISQADILRIFIRGLKAELKEHVQLQRPKTLDDAFQHAELKESLSTSQGSLTRQVSQLIQLKLQQKDSQQNIAALDSRDTFRGGDMITRDEIIRLINERTRQPENRPRSSRYNWEQFRNQRSYDGRPICDYCGKKGRSYNACFARERDFNREQPLCPFYRKNVYRDNYNPRFGASKSHRGPDPRIPHRQPNYVDSYNPVYTNRDPSNQESRPNTQGYPN